MKGASVRTGAGGLLSSVTPSAGNDAGAMTRFLSGFKPLAFDLVATLFFVALYWATASLLVATVAGILVGIGQIVWLAWRRQPIPPLQWVSLALVVVLGGASLLLNDPRLIMLKPSVAYFAVGCVMLAPNWMGRYLPPIVKENAPPWLFLAWGYVWAAAMMALSAGNLVLALRADLGPWARFHAIALPATMIVLVVLQGLTTRPFVRRGLMARRARLPDLAGQELRH